MEELRFEATGKTPNIVCDPLAGSIKISGVSVPEDAIDYYVPLKNWIQEYSENPKDDSVFTVEMEYFNTSTSRVLLDLFRLFEPISKKVSKTTINWIYDPEDWEMKEAGEEYQVMVGDIMTLTAKPMDD